MKSIIVVVALLFAGTLGAQTANVIELKPEDSTKVQKAWDELQRAQARWKDVNDQIDMQYVEVPYDGSMGNLVISAEVLKNGYHRRDGFLAGFEFSTDFKYIVPKPVTVDPKSPLQYNQNPIILDNNMPHCSQQSNGMGVCW